MLRLIAVVLFAVWLLLLLLGKGGYIHLLLLGSASLVFTEVVTEFRTRMNE